MEKIPVVVIGAGLSGLAIGAALTRLGVPYAILEKGHGIPPSKLHYIHSDVGTYVKFPLREVDVFVNAYWHGQFFVQATIDMMNAFSYNTTHKVFSNSMKFIDGRVHKAWVPEAGMESLNKLMAASNSTPPVFGCRVNKIDVEKKMMETSEGGIEFDKIIATIPLPMLFQSCIPHTFPIHQFKYEPLVTIEVKSKTEYAMNLFQIIYIPAADFGMVRISLLGNRIVAEGGNKTFDSVASLNGLRRFLSILLPNSDLTDFEMTLDSNPFGRYVPIDETERKQMMSWLESKGIYCLGRYAEWAFRRFDHILLRAVVVAREVKRMMQ